MLSSTWTLDDFKNAITNDIGSPPVRDVNLKVLWLCIFGDCFENFLLRVVCAFHTTII